jgi:hypothetical protein
MSTVSVTIRYGISKQVTKDVAEGSSIRSVITNPSVKAILGHPENVVPVIDGVTMGLNDTVYDGADIQLEQQAAQKAA